MEIREIIRTGQTWLGIEFGSTRIKAVLIGPDHQPIASGSHEWADRLENGIWTYSQEAILAGLQDCYRDLKADVSRRYSEALTTFGAMGVSAMMHGYLAFDKDMNLLVPFRTWRNTITAQAAAELTELFQFNIPQRWSIAHLHQAVLNNEEHLGRLAFFTTLAGYVHWMLTGKKVLGLGDAAGLFPIDSAACDWDPQMIARYNQLIAGRGLPWQITDLLPGVLPAGDCSCRLTEAGARLLDPAGDLQPGAIVCPPEGDAGTGMVATNSVAARTGNVSAGTSIFAMIVLEHPLKRLHTEIDMVTTPTGKPVAMVHCNTCTSDLNAWVGLLREALRTFGAEPDANEVYTRLFQLALTGDRDAGGMISFNYYSGEPVTGTDDGVPLFTRRPDLPMSLANFMRAQIMGALATLSIGMDTLTVEEQVGIDRVLGHGGLFKTPEVGQRLLAAAIHSPVTVMETAGEGGAWGIALLAAYAARREAGETLEAYLDRRVFADAAATTLAPDAEDVAGFDAYRRRYEAAIAAEKAACAALKG
ncbi:MAG: ATPase [Clostridia bacterium]|nr:ATPase [Clostridia bacterium]